MPLDLVASAPAKVNLTLRVIGRRADGYHDIESVVAFAGLCDRLSLTPTDELALAVVGPGAAQIGAESLEDPVRLLHAIELLVIAGRAS